MFRAAKDKVRQKKEVKKLTKVLIMHLAIIGQNQCHKRCIKCFLIWYFLKCDIMYFQVQQQPSKSKAPNKQKGGKTTGRVGGKR